MVTLVAEYLLLMLSYDAENIQSEYIQVHNRSAILCVRQGTSSTYPFFLRRYLLDDYY